MGRFYFFLALPVKRKIGIQKMILTLEKTEEKLCKLGLVTREIIEKRKREKHFGKPTCFILKKFQRTVREDYRTFFPRPPCWKIFCFVR